MSRQKREKPMEGRPDDVRFGTPPEVAEYRAERLACDTLIEAGAGAGFQTRAFSKTCKRVIAIELDADRLSRADFAGNVTPIAGDALEVDVKPEGKTIVFLDPERPAKAKQRDIKDIKPDINAFIEKYSDITDDIAIELPPFINNPPEGEREFISMNGELNRLTIYRGDLKRCDVSVVALPEGRRLEHNGPLPELSFSEFMPKYIIVPDRAVIHAGLTPLVLPEKYGKHGRFFTSENPGGEWCDTFEVIAEGETVKDKLEEAQTIILHGKIEPDEQKKLLEELNPLCQGKERLHLFLGEPWILTRRKMLK